MWSTDPDAIATYDNYRDWAKDKMKNNRGETSITPFFQLRAILPNMIDWLTNLCQPQHAKLLLGTSEKKHPVETENQFVRVVAD